ncbi:MAG: AI-2E family transporter [Reichenbachiella sp.]|uniref:AI-2E family transporter n=1 Tax=Reichenbachiella sp. TaxID=2184521 RepID=UPI0032678CAD
MIDERNTFGQVKRRDSRLQTLTTLAASNYLLTFLAAVLILYFGRTLFIPLSFSLLISLVLYPFCKWLENKGIPRSLSIAIGLISFSVLIISIIMLLVQQFILFTKEWPALQQKLTHVIDSTRSHIDQFYLDNSLGETGFLETIMQYGYDHVLPAIPEALYVSSISAVLLVLIPVYVALILFYRDILVQFLFSIIRSSRHHYVRNILPGVITTYYSFIKGMALVYLIVAVLNTSGLAIIGIPNPIFFGFIASILTFIPYVGITIGALLPIAVAWLKYDSVLYPIGVVIVFTVVQILEANLIFPIVVSKKLKINALVAIIVIIAGGIIWGASGMILFLPFVAILKLVADQMKETEPISILLGGS